MTARLIRVRGVVQGVGFRPFVYRLASAHELRGWVLNQEDGVEIHVEGDTGAIERFVRALRDQTPPAAVLASIDVSQDTAANVAAFEIRESHRAAAPTVRISPDLAVCDACLAELFDPNDARFRYPYINCTNCGPRYSIIESLPYDRARTTMAHWKMDALCARQYNDPLDRRFHAQPVACPVCGPHYFLERGGEIVSGDIASISAAADLLRVGGIVAVKGIGGYHLSCDARSAAAVQELRQRKFRKEKPFAVMVRDLEMARELVDLSPEEEKLMGSTARPIVLASAKTELAGVAPGTHELGVMLAYTPMHYLLFAAGAPAVLVMTSANRSSEPIAYGDEEARERLAGLEDAFLIGERPIARRVDDSVARAGEFGPMILRRSRGYAPGVVTTLPTRKPILALGADLKNTITLVVDGQAFVSQHIGDLDHYEAFAAFKETIRDLLEMYSLDPAELTVVHDLHPEYVSTLYAEELRACKRIAVQHHRAHLGSVLAERQAWDRRVVGVSFDGTGYGDDGTIWGGEFFVGSMREGFERAVHLRPALLPGGDSAARFPVQCAAGYLHEIVDLPNLRAKPFHFPDRYASAKRLVESRLRTFATSSMGRLFDTVAAVLGFTGEISFEGQAAIWVEQLARKSSATEPYAFAVCDEQLDFRPLLKEVIECRAHGQNIEDIARQFHTTVVVALCDTVEKLCNRNSIDLAILSGGVFQNQLLLQDAHKRLQDGGLEVWTNSAVPANDGGISLGQAAVCSATRLSDRVHTCK
ncbi:MAG TPA: carbamoyltransferase HypF [Bryobacteraceae bacterium]|nr:carbamoyltransferase HypF [Bryobacteraceae bacterium]